MNTDKKRLDWIARNKPSASFNESEGMWFLGWSGGMIYQNRSLRGAIDFAMGTLHAKKKAKKK